MIVEEDISIHPPHAGRDQIAARINSQMIGFQSTRPMRGGTLTIFPRSISWVFQSTRPMRGGTANISRSAQKSGYFNPPAPCGAGPRDSLNRQVRVGISIHPPHAGRDVILTRLPWTLLQFQSTRPMRGGTWCCRARWAIGFTFQSTRPMRGGTRPARF